MLAPDYVLGSDKIIIKWSSTRSRMWRPRFPWKCTHPLIQRAASQRRQCQQEGALHVLGAILCHPHRRPGHLQLQSLGPHTAPSAYVIKTNQSQLQNTENPSCGNPVEFENGILTCEDFSPDHPQIGLIMRHLSTLHQFAQINLIIVPKTQQANTISTQRAM